MPPPGRLRSYRERSRSHRHSLLFALPLLLAYELLELVAPVREGAGTVRNGADVVLSGAARAVLGPRGPVVLMATVIVAALWLVWRDRRSGPLHLATFGGMMLESCVLALAFGVVVGGATVRLLGPLRSLAAGVVESGALASLTLSLGAGLYEELLFRVILVSALAWGFRMLGASRLIGGTLAVLAGALLFSAFHYIGPLGDPPRLESFVFRAIAGVAFSAMYLLRGFGITAWTHALYDVAVLM